MSKQNKIIRPTLSKNFLKSNYWYHKINGLIQSIKCQLKKYNFMTSVGNETVIGFKHPSTKMESFITVNESSEITKLQTTDC
jgi:hypothetical protein